MGNLGGFVTMYFASSCLFLNNCSGHHEWQYAPSSLMERGAGRESLKVYSHDLWPTPEHDNIKPSRIGYQYILAHDFKQRKAKQDKKYR